MKYWQGLGKRTADDVTGFGRDTFNRATTYASREAKAFAEYITRRAQELMKFAQDTAGQVTGSLGSLGKGKRGLYDDLPGAPKGYTCMTLPPNAASYATRQLRGGPPPGSASGFGGPVTAPRVSQQRGLPSERDVNNYLQWLERTSREMMKVLYRRLQEMKEMYARLGIPLPDQRTRPRDNYD
jgi:hypothetical protein